MTETKNHRLHKIVHDLCSLSIDVYDEKQPGDIISGGWKCLMNLFPLQGGYPSGFAARLYGHDYFKETVVAYRGTSVLRWGDIVADILLKMNDSSAYDHAAIVYYKAACSYLASGTTENYLITPMLTGHSLGGYLAQIVAIKNAQSKPLTVAFNAPGPGGAYIDDLGYINPTIHYDYIYNYSIWQDKVHRVGIQVGNLKEVRNKNIDCFMNAFKLGPAYRVSYEVCQHSIDTVNKQIDSFPELNI